MAWYVEARVGGSGWHQARVWQGRPVFGGTGALQRFRTRVEAENFVRSADLGGAPAPDEVRIVEGE